MPASRRQFIRTGLGLAASASLPLVAGCAAPAARTANSSFACHDASVLPFFGNAAQTIN